MKPSISAFCTTYGRPARLMNEVVECFLRQDYEGESELVILSDYARQTVIYDGDKRVRIFNEKERILPLGRVFNATIAKCEGDIIMPWESDDIFLPHRMSLSVERMQAGLFHSPNAWFYDYGKDHIEEMGNWCLCNLAAHKDLWKEVGYFNAKGVASIDTELITAMYQAAGHGSVDLKPEERFYIYRWNNGSYHASGWGGDNENMANDVANAVRIEWVTGGIETGDVVLEPQWYRDYSAIVAGYIAKQKEHSNGNQTR